MEEDKKKRRPTKAKNKKKKGEGEGRGSKEKTKTKKKNRHQCYHQRDLEPIGPTLFRSPFVTSVGFIAYPCNRWAQFE